MPAAAKIGPITQAELQTWLDDSRALEERAYQFALRSFRGSKVEAGPIRMKPLDYRPVKPDHRSVVGCTVDSFRISWDKKQSKEAA